MDAAPQELSLGLALMCAGAVFVFGLWLNRGLFGTGGRDDIE
jgi:hypothetical protein